MQKSGPHFAASDGVPIRVGISGWTYAGWRDVFYPSGLAHKRELDYASTQFPTIEINGTFYRLQRPENYAHWYAATPDDFQFGVKGSRFITHMQQLRDVRTSLANFFASGLLRLEEKLGPILWQFPARMSYDEPKFHAFLELLPKSSRDAARLARRHDARLDGRSWSATKSDRPIRYAFEVRHPSFLIPEFLELLRHHNCALVFSDSAGEWPYVEDVTAGFIYLRLHGADELYASGYDATAIDWWARRVILWSSGKEPADAFRIGRPAPRIRERDVFVYFDNDRKVRAPFDARQLIAQLKRVKARKVA